MENNNTALYFVAYMLEISVNISGISNISGNCLSYLKKIARGEVLDLRATQENILHYIYYIYERIWFMHYFMEKDVDKWYQEDMSDWNCVIFNLIKPYKTIYGKKTSLLYGHVADC